MLQAAHDFLYAWLVDDNFDQAATFFSTRCHECVDLYLPDGEKPPATPAEHAAYIRNALTTVGKDVGTVRHLKDALEPVQPDHEDVRVVSHAGEGAYTVVAVADYLAGAFLCDRKSARNPYQPAAESGDTYGYYYATLFALRTPGEHPAAITLLWAKEGGQWKIIAYELTAQ